MYYTPAYEPPAAGGRPARPAVVTAAVGLQLGAALLMLVLAALGTAAAIQFDDLVVRAGEAGGATTEAIDAQRFAFGGIAVTSAGSSLLIGLALLGLAVPVGRGHNVPRILTLIALGVAALGCCCSPVGGVFFQAVLYASPPSTDEPAFDEALADLADAEGPSDWYGIPAGVAAAIVFVAGLAAFVLLLVPPANRFFRKTPSEFAVPGYAYPGVGYPPTPGGQPPQWTGPVLPGSSLPIPPGSLASPSPGSPPQSPFAAPQQSGWPPPDSPPAAAWPPRDDPTAAVPPGWRAPEAWPPQSPWSAPAPPPVPPPPAAPAAGWSSEPPGRGEEPPGRGEGQAARDEEPPGRGEEPSGRGEEPPARGEEQPGRP